MEKDLSILNKTIGDFVVIAEAPSDNDGNAMWQVKCMKCGYTKNCQRNNNKTSFKEWNLNELFCL